MKRARRKTPTPAATGAGVRNHKLAGCRFTPMYIDPFTGAMSPTDVGEACARELSRRLCNVSRVARGAA